MSLYPVGSGGSGVPADNSVTNAKLADMAQATIKGRAAGAGTGDPQDLSAAQARAAMGLGTAAEKNIPATGNASSTEVVYGTDTRLTDSRTPTSHASSHNAGGSDALAIDAVAGTGSLRTLGTSATSACAGDDSRLSNARAPTAHQSTHAANGSDSLPWTGIHGRGATADKPSAAASNAGYLYYDTDLQRLERSNGTSWDVLTTSSSTNTIRNGTGAPSNALGNDGDFYIATDTDYIYGPKAGGVWPAGESIIGPQGPTGTTGAAGSDGKTILNGTGAPSNGLGVNGDFYIATDTNYIYGPKAGGVWPAGVSLVGPTGATGATGAAGSNGTNGTDGKTTLSGTGAPSNANGNNGDFYIDTQNWVIYGPKSAGAWPVGVKYAYVDMGTDGSAGVNWDKNTSAVDNQWYSVCWSPERSLFVAVADSGTGNRVMTSPDGITWTARTSAADNNWISVCWSPSLLLFVAVAYSGTGNRVMTSPDGITWTARTSAADNNWFSVCWSPALAIFVAVAATGTGNRVMTSSDGVTWTLRTSAADNTWRSVCWSPELSLFVAVAESGTGNRVMTSPNGTTWTTRTSAADNQWYSVCWSPERSLFVAVAISGVGNRVMTSPDGVTWAARTSAADNNWTSVCWSPGRSLFVAVSYTGTGNRVMTSPDGVTWTARTSAADNNWFGICWSPSLSVFVAVAQTGTGTRVMTSRGRQAASSPSGLVATLSANTFTGAQKVQAAANQDAVELVGRAGGTSGFKASVTPLALSANRTLSLPDEDGTVALRGANTFTGTQTVSVDGVKALDLTGGATSSYARFASANRVLGSTSASSFLQCAYWWLTTPTVFSSSNEVNVFELALRAGNAAGGGSAGTIAVGSCINGSIQTANSVTVTTGYVFRAVSNAATTKWSFYADAGSGVAYFGDGVSVPNTTDATSKDTGSIVTEGGIGVEKSIFAGGPSCTVAGQVRMHYDSGTGERGMQVKISNRTGETSVKGKLVHPSSSNDSAVELVSASAPYTPCGVIYEAGIANGSDMWVWMPGSVVEFLMENSDATTRQDWLRASATTNGRVQSAAVPTPPNSDSHFTECGHALESNAGGTDQLVLGFFHVL